MFRCYRAVSVSEVHELLAEMAGTAIRHIIMTMSHSSRTLGSEVEPAKRTIRFRRVHLSALREAVKKIKEDVRVLEVWRNDMPEEAVDSRVIECGEAAKVTTVSTFLLLDSTVQMEHRSKTQTYVPTL